jgi:branched-chain amino acid aminotransferase
MATEVATWRIQPGQTTPEPLRFDPPPASLNALSQQLPAGGYTTFRTYSGQSILHFSDHLARLEETAHLTGMLMRLDPAAIRAALRQALAAYGAPEARGRITLDLSDQPGTLYISLAALEVPTSQDYEQGIRTVICDLHRQNPKAKSTDFITQAEAVRRSLPPGIAEALLASADGRLLEGLSSNFFAVRGGVVWTAAEGVLLGITRKMVLEETAAEGLPLRLEGYPRANIAQLDEAFITSASRAVLSVIEIEGQPVGTGRPGPISQRLLQRYNARLGREVEPI